MPGDLRPLLDHLPAWLMVVFRLSGIFLFAPLFGSTALFRQVKVFLIVGLACCVYPMLLEPGRQSAQIMGAVINGEMSLWMLAPTAALELLIGLAIGYTATLPMIGMQIGGQVIDQQIGLGLAGIFNPDLGEQSGIVGQFMFMVALAVYVTLGGHRILLGVLIGSFDHIPIGGFHDFGALLDLVVGVLQAAFSLALRLAAPLLCLIFLQTVAMGFIMRTVPQINILSIGFPMRTMAGAFLLVMFISMGVRVFAHELEEVLWGMMQFFAGA